MKPKQQMKTAPIYFVSLGPGDPELITLQSLRRLEQSDYIFTPVPVSAKGRHSSKAVEMMLSLGIKESQLSLYDLPMSKNRDGASKAYLDVAEQIVALRSREPEARIAVVAEGDSGFYSSSAYIGEHIEKFGLPTKQLCGVPALIACNALMGGQLVQLEEQLRVVPGEATEKEWKEVLASKHTLVVMKGSLAEEPIKKALVDYPERHWHYFEFVGMAKEFYTDQVAEIQERTFPYFSIIISKSR